MCAFVLIPFIRGASTSTYVHRISAEQQAIEARLVELVGVESINTGLKQVFIKGEDDMVVDIPEEPPISRTLDAKRRAVARYVRFTTTGRTITNSIIQTPANGSLIMGSIDMQEAIELQQRAHAADLERRRRQEEKKQRLNEKVLTEKERYARILAFMWVTPAPCPACDSSDFVY